MIKAKKKVQIMTQKGLRRNKKVWNIKQKHFKETKTKIKIRRMQENAQNCILLLSTFFLKCVNFKFYFFSLTNSWYRFRFLLSANMEKTNRYWIISRLTKNGIFNQAIFCLVKYKQVWMTLFWFYNYCEFKKYNCFKKPAFKQTHCNVRSVDIKLD
jgi:hypothetical protein